MKALYILPLFSVLFFAGCSNNTLPNEPRDTILIEEFSDIECPFCKRIHPVIKKLQEDFPNVDFEYRYFPLESIHPHAFGAAAASECIKEEKGEESFGKYLTDLYASSNLDITTLVNIGEKYEMNSEEFRECIKSPSTSSKIRSDIREGISRGVQGTPTLFINEEKVPSEMMSYEKLYAKISELNTAMEANKQ